MARTDSAGVRRDEPRNLALVGLFLLAETPQVLRTDLRICGAFIYRGARI